MKCFEILFFKSSDQRYISTVRCMDLFGILFVTDHITLTIK